MAYLVLVRHGQSKWNLLNKFSGWVDVPLSAHGIWESQKTARELRKYTFDIAYCSNLCRAQQTLLTILSEQDRTGIFTHNGKKKHTWLIDSNKPNSSEIPIIDTEKLNERYYGELQGMDKDEARQRFGEEKVLAWRRGYADRPPRGESLQDVYKRVAPFFEKKIVRDLKVGKNVIVATHGNSLRAIIKHIESVADDAMPQLEFPTGRPVIYEYDRKGKLNLINDHLSFDRAVYWSKPVISS